MRFLKIELRTYILATALLFLGHFTYGQTITSDYSEDYVHKANNQFSKGQWEAGKTIVDQGLKVNSKDSDLKMLSGKYYHHLKQYDKARYELVKALEINPNNVDAKQILVNVETESKRYSSAICYVNELLEVNPYWKGLWRKKVELYELQGNHIEANRLRKRISQIYPNDEQLKNDYLYSTELEATSKRQEGKIEESLVLSKSLVQENPTNQNYYLSVINDYLKNGDHYNALAYSERGLMYFPHNIELINKKVGILEEQKRYDEILTFLQQKQLTTQYNYYLLEAARNAKDKDPFTLYGKLFEANASNEEAFNYVFNHLFNGQQYEEALTAIDRHRKSKGDSKNLALKELLVYNRLGNNDKVASLTKQLFYQYNNDQEIREAYVQVMLMEAKANMEQLRYHQAIANWYQVSQYGDSEMNQIAQNGIYTSYVALGDYSNALNTLNNLIEENPSNYDLYFKRSDIYFKQNNFYKSATAYEDALKLMDDNEKLYYLEGYGELMTKIIKYYNDEFLYNESLQYVNRWLLVDSVNLAALKYGASLAYQVKDQNALAKFIKQGRSNYPDDVFFKVKDAELNIIDKSTTQIVYEDLYRELKNNPYHKNLIDAFAQATEKYTLVLLKENEAERALEIIDTGLLYSGEDKTLLYTKGLVLEKLKRYDQAYLYQQNYEVSPLEIAEFKQHLNYLNYKSYRNEVGIEHLRSRFADSDHISTVSSFQYSYLGDKNTYTGRANYAGRDQGKGIQGQLEWSHTYNNKWSSRLNVALANQFFPKFTINGSVYKQINFFTPMELEVGLGYRRVEVSDDNTSNKQGLFNVVLGLTKELDKFRLNAKLDNFVFDDQYLYNLSINARYFLSSPKNYISAMAGVGSSPDVELIDYKFYNGFSVINTMVGAGYSRIVYHNVSLGVLGTWYNYKAGDNNYRNLYNLYFNLNVTF